MKDELLMKYLPTKEQLSERLPERDFFFCLMCTLRNQYMKDIIAGAHKARYTVVEDDTKKQAISISEAWMAEIQNHPNHSSKIHHLSVRFTHLMQEWFHSMKERAIVRFSKVNFSLASLDVLKPDFVLQVNAMDGRWRYLLLTKSSMEHLRSLSQW
jgi:hypothetical protein